MVDRVFNAPPPGVSWALWNANIELHRRRAGSTGSSVCISSASDNEDRWPPSAIAAPVAPAPLSASVKAETVDAAAASSTQLESVVVYNEVLVAILKAKEVALARVWLVARALDPQGCGHVPVVDLYEMFPSLSSRRVRQILEQGEGRYWTVGAGVVYLRSQEKVANRLGVNRVRCHSLAVPVAKLVRSVRAAKAVFWNAVHCGRKSSHPISREALSNFGVKDPRTQRSLERLEGVTAEQQFAILGPANEYDRQQAEESGEPIFIVNDYKGHLGKRGRTYLARHLPNVYSGTLKAVSHGKKWFNRRLCKLHEKGPGANTRPQIERTFFADGKQAGRAWDKQPVRDSYWPARRAKEPRAWWSMRGISPLYHKYTQRREKSLP